MHRLCDLGQVSVLVFLDGKLKKNAQALFASRFLPLVFEQETSYKPKGWFKERCGSVSPF
jgi:hypothetical protein